MSKNFVVGILFWSVEVMFIYVLSVQGMYFMVIFQKNWDIKWCVADMGTAIDSTYCAFVIIKFL